MSHPNLLQLDAAKIRGIGGDQSLEMSHFQSILVPGEISSILTISP